MTTFVVIVLTATITAAIVFYLKRDAHGFELLFHAMSWIAFYRCFKAQSERNIEDGLEKRQQVLMNVFQSRDYCRERVERETAYVEFHHGARFAKEGLQLANESLQKSELTVLECQRTLDYAIAVAFLSGFGKIARKFAR